MGYWSDHKPKYQSFDEWAKKKYSYENDDCCVEVLATGLVNLVELYLAVKRTDKATGNHYTFAVVVLVRPHNDSYQNIMVKVLDEFCGPVYTRCPPKIFKLLTPLKDIELPDSLDNFEYAEQWRENVKEYYNTLDKIKQLDNGTCIEFNKPIKFDGNAYYRFKLFNKKKKWFTPEEKPHFIVKLPKYVLLDRSWQVA